MPLFLCPCCGGSYVVPLAFCEHILEAREAVGNVAPALCVNCQEPLEAGTVVFLRRGCGLTEAGEVIELPEGGEATITTVATWDGDGSIFLVQLAAGQHVYVNRALLTTRKLENGYYLHQPEEIAAEITDAPSTSVEDKGKWWQLWK